MQTSAERCCLALFVMGGVVYAASVGRNDREFMNTAARMDMIEAHEGQMAERQANGSATKDLAKTVVQDHSQSYGQIAELAAKKSVSIPKGIDAAKEGTIERLGSLKGTNFDRQFANEEIAGQRREIAVFKRESERGEDADVKAYATNALPILEKDLKQAQTLAKSAGR